MDFNMWKLRDFPLRTQNIPTLFINELSGLVRMCLARVRWELSSSRICLQLL